MGETWVVEIDSSDPALPSLNGPFTTKAEGQAWGEANIRNGEWGVRPVAEPTTRKLDPLPWARDGSHGGGRCRYSTQFNEDLQFAPRPEFEQSEAAYTERTD